MLQKSGIPNFLFKMVGMKGSYSKSTGSMEPLEPVLTGALHTSIDPELLQNMKRRPRVTSFLIHIDSINACDFYTSLL